MFRSIILLSVVLSWLPATLRAQGSQGVITYEMKVNLHRNLPPGREDMKSMLPEFSTTRYALTFSETQSLYKTLVDEEDDVASFNGGNGRMMMMRRAMNQEIFTDQENQMVTARQEVMGKEYLIEDTLKVSPWKFGSETRTINGYVCRMAYYTDESRPDRKQEVTAWFTDKLRPFLGPERFNSLPGAVLAVDVNGGERVIVVKSVEVRELKKNEMKKPSSGTRVTGAEFRKLMQERMKEMRGQGGSVIIRN